MRALPRFAAIAWVLLLPAVVQSAPVTWPTNGHQYEAINAPAGITWEAAYDSCLARGGYLATLTSAAEHAFVYSLVSGRPELWYIDGFNNGIGPWFGGMQPTGSGEPGGGWRWVSGEPWSYTAWSPGEPNNSGGAGEDRLVFFQLGGLIGDRWNDFPHALPVKGWIVEIPVAAVDCSTWADNGHNYQLVRTPGRVTWEGASAGSIARGGHLATIGSAAENDFVAAFAGADPALWRIDAAGNGQGPWIGGLQAGGSAEPSGGWGWCTGEPWTFTNWAPFEPNNLNNVEDRLQLFGKGTLTGNLWNDIDTNTPYGGFAYVVEYESGPGCVATSGVPDPAGSGVALARPAPNPARGPVLLRFTLPRAGFASLQIFGSRGERIRTLIDGSLPAGDHARMWDGRDARGTPVAAGVYFARLEALGASRTEQVVVVSR